MARQTEAMRRMAEGDKEEPIADATGDIATVSQDFEKMILDAEDKLMRFEERVEGKPYGEALDRLKEIRKDLGVLDLKMTVSAKHFNRGHEVTEADEAEWTALQAYVHDVNVRVISWEDALIEEEKVVAKLQSIARTLRDLDGIINEVFHADVGLDRPSDFVRMFPMLEGRLNELREDFNKGKEKHVDKQHLSRDFAELNEEFITVRTGLYGAKAWFKVKYPHIRPE